jgi:hypothetical protein
MFATYLTSIMHENIFHTIAQVLFSKIMELLRSSSLVGKDPKVQVFLRQCSTMASPKLQCQIISLVKNQCQKIELSQILIKLTLYFPLPCKKKCSLKKLFFENFKIPENNAISVKQGIMALVFHFWQFFTTW